jgi:hypothetical protein
MDSNFVMSYLWSCDIIIEVTVQVISNFGDCCDNFRTLEVDYKFVVDNFWIINYDSICF